VFWLSADHVTARFVLLLASQLARKMSIEPLERVTPVLRHVNEYHVFQSFSPGDTARR
jgi:hypothetical protein